MFRISICSNVQGQVYASVIINSYQDISQLNIWQLFCYGALSLPIAMGGFALVTYIPTFYAVDLGLGLGLVGFIFVIGRLFDVITDPILGHLSDRTQSRIGARRPWMIVGVPLFCLAVWALFVPIGTPGLGYLIAASAAYFLFYTVLDVPYSSVGLEISTYIHERSVLASTKAVFQILGAIAAALIPFILVLATAASLKTISQIIIVLCFVCLALFLIFVPRKPMPIAQTRPAFIPAVKTAWTNPLYSKMILAFFIIQTANALLAALTVLFVTNVLKTPEMTGLLLAILFMSSALFLPLWVWISKKWSKKTSWLCSIGFASAVLLIAPFMGAGDITLAIGFSVLIGACFGCDAIMPTSMLADIVHRDELDGKGQPAALYLAMKNSVSKLTFIAPMGLAFPLLEFAGFVSGEDNSVGAASLLLIFYAGLPILLRLLAFVLVWNLPKTEGLFAK